MRSSLGRILLLAAFLGLGACANDNSDELTPAQKERIEQIREARRRQQADPDQDSRESENREAPAPQPAPQPERPESRSGRDGKKPVVLPETAPIPQPRPVEETEASAVPKTVTSATVEQAPPKIELPPKKEPPVSSAHVPKPAPESGKCKYVSGLSNEPPRGRVVMTFDDGPSAKLTPSVLEVLKKYRVRATFFMLGSEATDNSALARRVRDAGHLVGSHSWDHPDFHKLSETDQKSQIDRTENVLETLFAPQKYFRYPYGNSTCAGNAYLHRHGYAIVGWHVDSCDWAFAEHGRVSDKDAEICGVSSGNRANFVGHVVQQVKSHHGGIVLMHDIQAKTIRQLDTLLAELLRQGFEFTNLDDPEFQASLR